MTQNKALGKGLSILMGMQRGVDTNIPELRNGEPCLININEIKPGRFQPRRVFEEESLKELTDSIKSFGVLTPVLLRDRDGSGFYELIAGERRWRASKLAGLEQIPAVVKRMSDSQVLECALIENIQRKDLNPIEEAEGYNRLIQEYGYGQEDLARVVSKSRSHVANLLRLLNLPDEIKRMVEYGKLTMGHARTLINCEDSIALAEKIIKAGMSVRATESMVKKYHEAQRAIASGDKIASTLPADRPETSGTQEVKVQDQDLSDIEAEVSRKLGMIVKIRDDAVDGGTVTIKFKTLEELDLILQLLE